MNGDSQYSAGKEADAISAKFQKSADLFNDRPPFPDFSPITAADTPVLIRVPGAAG